MRYKAIIDLSMIVYYIIPGMYTRQDKYYLFYIFIRTFILKINDLIWEDEIN